MKPRKYIHTLKPGTRVAFDENINDKIIGQYARSGCVVVYVAGSGMMDEDWVAEAICCDPDVIFSFDSDIGNILDKLDSNVQWRIP